MSRVWLYDPTLMHIHNDRSRLEIAREIPFFGKTASLLQETHEHSHLQLILMSIMFVLVALSLTLCIINLIYLLVKGVGINEALSFTIVLLVASIPLAIEIVTTTTLAIGSKELVKHGAIVARLAAIEDLAGMSILCSDKTGTLTMNQMVLQDDTPVYTAGQTQESVLVNAAIAAKWKEPARDALDRLTLGSVNMELMELYEQLDYVPFDPNVKRTEGTVRDTRTGEVFKTSKGAPHIIMKLLADSDNATREACEKDVARLGEKGIRSLAVARTNADGVWELMGLLTLYVHTYTHTCNHHYNYAYMRGSPIAVLFSLLLLCYSFSCSVWILLVWIPRRPLKTRSITTCRSK